MNVFPDLFEIGEVPFLEDLMNSNLLDFLRWRVDLGFDILEQAPPSYAVNAQKGLASVATGRQAGVRGSKSSLDPLLDIDDDKFRHL